MVGNSSFTMAQVSGGRALSSLMQNKVGSLAGFRGLYKGSYVSGQCCCASPTQYECIQTSDGGRDRFLCISLTRDYLFLFVFLVLMKIIVLLWLLWFPALIELSLVFIIHLFLGLLILLVFLFIFYFFLVLQPHLLYTHYICVDWCIYSCTCVFKMDTLTQKWSSIVSSASSHSTSGISAPNSSISIGCWNRFLLPEV